MWNELQQLTKTHGIIFNPLNDNSSNEYLSQILLIRMKEQMQIMNMRQIWSILFLLIIFVILVFEILLTFFVGMRFLEYHDEWFLRIIILGGFAQILGMPIIVTKFLFNTNSVLSHGKANEHDLYP